MATPNIIFSDFPDVDVIRVGNVFYMISTTMHFFPSCAILQSYNLVDWEIINYVSPELDGTSGQRLQDGQGIYGKGMWAGSLRYHNGIFYVAFVCNDTQKTYLFKTSDIRGNWEKSEIQGFYHDLSLLFDDDKVFMVSGNTNIRLIELNDDLSGPKEGGIDKIIISDKSERILGYEGSHFYKINGKYYVFLIHWPKGGMRSEACFVSDQIDGEYSGCDVLHSDFMDWKSGVAQGGIVDDGKGNWYGILFQDHGAMGRMPVLVPVSFNDDFPVFGIEGKVPLNIQTIDLNPNYKYKPLFCNDFLDSNGKVNLCWQWNHIPDFNFCSFSAKNEYVIQSNSVVKNPLLAKNTLTQRAFTHNCAAKVLVDFSSIKNGDFAGLCALQGGYAFIGITKENDDFYLVVAQRKSEVEKWKIGSVDNDNPEIVWKMPVCSFVKNNFVTLQLEFQFSPNGDFAYFSYFDETKNDFVQVDFAKELHFTLDQFVGVRFALFYYSTIQGEVGGKVTFKDFEYMVL